jgi:hypothetical protein
VRDNAALGMVANDLMSISQTVLNGAVGTLNVTGKTLQRIGLELPRLDYDHLLHAARRRTGLYELGPWPIAEPLSRLLESYNKESHLTMLGRITVRELVVSLLENLLLLDAELDQDSRITEQRIEAPTFIIGLPRTGTTLLHGLMSVDPENRVPRTWEVMYPASFANDPAGIAGARDKTAARLAWANRLAPQFKKIHPIAPDLPQECIAITAQVFMSIQFHTTHDVPSYEDWFEGNSQALAYAFHRRLLQHLQARRPGQRWVLKAPGHLFALEELLSCYPDARIVQTHRDPLCVMASMASHATTLRRAFSDRADPERIAADWSHRWSSGLSRFLAARDSSDSHRFLDVSYSDIEARPRDTMAVIYDFLGWRFTQAAQTAMAAFLDANPKNKHGVHSYSLSEFGLDRERELARFADYCKRFDITVQAEV